MVMSLNDNKKKLCVVTADAVTLNAFLMNHLRVLSKYYEITLVCSNPEALAHHACQHIRKIKIHRQINVYQDIGSLLNILRFFREENFDAAWSISPKAGLITMSAAFLAGVRIRVHCFTGQVWVNKFGLTRALLKYLDKLNLYLTTNPLCDSFSQKQFLKSENFNVTKMQVIANGSISGVDTDRFQPNAINSAKVRSELLINRNAFVIVFVGRLNKDKGILDLLKMMEVLADKYEIELLLVGPDEVGINEIIGNQREVVRRHCHIVGMTDLPEEYLQAGDLFCLPSYREGFGSSIIEASSVGLPVLCYKIYGVVDAVLKNKTGYLVPVGDISALVNKVEELYLDADLRHRLGLNGRKNAIERFSREVSTNFILCFFQSIVNEKIFNEND